MQQIATQSLQTGYASLPQDTVESSCSGRKASQLEINVVSIGQNDLTSRKAAFLSLDASYLPTSRPFCFKGSLI
jgi:hypothetical protein